MRGILTPASVLCDLVKRNPGPAFYDPLFLLQNLISVLHIPLEVMISPEVSETDLPPYENIE